MNELHSCFAFSTALNAIDNYIYKVQLPNFVIALSFMILILTLPLSTTPHWPKAILLTDAPLVSAVAKSLTQLVIISLKFSDQKPKRQGGSAVIII